MNIKKYIPLIISLGLLMENLDISVINTAIPQMAISLMSNPLAMKLGITSYLLTLAAFIPISGYIADKYGAKFTYFYAMVIFLLGSFFCGFAHSLTELVIGRLIQGVGGAMMTPVGRLILIKSYTKSELVKAFSLFTMIGQVGVAIGPVIGGMLTTYISWRYIFFVNIPFGILALILIRLYIPNYKAEEVDKFDFIGFIIFAISAGLISFSTSLISETALESSSVYLMFVIGTILLVIFCWHASKISNPSLSIQLFKIRTFRIAVLGSLLMRIGIGGLPFLLPLLLQVAYGYTAFSSGLMLIPYGVAMVIAKPFIKRILGKYGFKTMLMVNPIIISGLVFTLAGLSQHLNVTAILLSVFFIGFFSSMQFTYMTLLSFVDIEKADDSKATSVGSVVQQLSMSFGVCTVALLLSVLNGGVSANLIHLNSFTWCLFILGFICLATLLIFRDIKASDGTHLTKN